MRSGRRKVRLLLAWLFLLSGVAQWLVAAPDERTAYRVQIRGAIGPATSDHVVRALEKAAREGAALVVLELDTPGGLDTSMREIVKAILASPAPVVCYVAPSGARAASAGTYILYACHVAAMAPGTNLGAATPVEIGGPAPGRAPESGEGDETSEDGNAKTLERKRINDAVAWIRSLAKLRGRNAEWAEQAVREAASLPAEEALEKGVIDLVAPDLDALLRAIDGREVAVPGGHVRLDTRDLVVREIAPDWRTRLLERIADPNLAYVLMLLGIYGLIFELANPGFILPGVAGTICLLLALFAFHVLPVNEAGIGLMLVGILFMIAEIFVPSFGALGIGGLIAFAIGSVMLFDEESGAVAVAPGLIAGFTLATGVFLFGVVGLAVRSRRRPVVSGAEELIGAEGVALEDFRDGCGAVHVHGERWSARSGQPIHKGQPVRVTGRRDLLLFVEPVSETPACGPGVEEETTGTAGKGEA
ncbi:MAG TPA: nodulation protein NfeD [Thiotrichales bacterium]|nr:nodulation protein NfeD [Thiotrichales bacterium]